MDRFVFHAYVRNGEVEKRHRDLFQRAAPKTGFPARCVFQPIIQLLNVAYGAPFCKTALVRSRAVRGTTAGDVRNAHSRASPLPQAFSPSVIGIGDRIGVRHREIVKNLARTAAHGRDDVRPKPDDPKGYRRRCPKPGRLWVGSPANGHKPKPLTGTNVVSTL
ncbi:MAG TPA: hypothetical protein VGB36_12970 [Gammaproteobacteria bacterium]